MGGGVDQGVQLATSGFTGIADRLGALSRVNRPTEEDAYAGAREGTSSSHLTVRHFVQSVQAAATVIDTLKASLSVGFSSLRLRYPF